MEPTPHRRCKHASTMTDDASARHRQPHRRRASATDASGNNARDGAATNTFYPLTLFHGLDQSQRQLLSASHPSPSVTSQCYAPSGALGPGATRIGCAYLDGLCACG